MIVRSVRKLVGNACQGAKGKMTPVVGVFAVKGGRNVKHTRQIEDTVGTARLLTIAIIVSSVLALSLCACSGEGAGAGSAGSAGSASAGSSSAGVPMSSSGPVAFTYRTNVAHHDVPLDQRSRDSFDQEAYLNDFYAFKSAVDNDATDLAELMRLYDKLAGHVMNLNSDYALARFDYRQDVSNALAVERYVAKRDLLSDTTAKCAYQFGRALESPQGKGFRAHIGSTFAYALDRSANASSEAYDLRKQRNDLVVRYDKLAAQGASETELKELYIEMVNTNNALARACGYDNYAEYAYAVEYRRDYTVDDALRLQEAIARDYVPVYQAYLADSLDVDLVYQVFDENNDTSEVKLANVRKCVASVSPALTEAVDHLQRNGLYDISAVKTYANDAFTMEIPSYNDAFMVIAPEGDVTDYQTLIHEFGHFNHMYHAPSNAFVSNDVPDVQETMSQALELLCCGAYDELCPGYGEALAAYVVYDKAQTVREAFAINEAEYRAYTTPNVTPEKIDAIWADVREKYRMSQEDESWTATSHIFSKPFYYIGYGTSALAALSLYVDAQDDFASAVTKYLILSEAPPETMFCQALDLMDKGDLMDPDKMAAFSQKVGKVLAQ